MNDGDVLKSCGIGDGSEISFAESIGLVKDKIIDAGIRGDICGDCSWDYICEERKYAGEVSGNSIVWKYQV